MPDEPIENGNVELRDRLAVAEQQRLAAEQIIKRHARRARDIGELLENLKSLNYAFFTAPSASAKRERIARLSKALDTTEKAIGEFDATGAEIEGARPQLMALIEDIRDELAAALEPPEDPDDPGDGDDGRRE